MTKISIVLFFRKQINCLDFGQLYLAGQILPFHLIAGFAEAAFPSGEVIEGFDELVFFEIGPERVCEVEFGIRYLPEEIVGDPVFAACPDDEVGIGHIEGVEVFGNQFFVDFFRRYFTVGGHFGNFADCCGYFLARAVTECECERHFWLVISRFGNGFVHKFEQVRREFVFASDYVESDIFFNKKSLFRYQELFEKFHESRNFAFGTIPVFGGKSVKREVFYPDFTA